MGFFKCVLLLVAMFAITYSMPVPEPQPGFLGPSHEHYILHVPYNIHTVHHHHVHKVHVPIIKEIPIIKEVHYEKPWHGWW